MAPIMQPNHVSTTAKIERGLEEARRRLVETSKEIGDLIARGGNDKRLAVLRRERDEARNAVEEMEAGLAVSQRLDREAVASAAAQSRSQQLSVFQKAMAGRLKAMTSALEALATFANAYGEYSQATLTAMESIPAGTIAPQIAMGPLGGYGASWSNCQRMLEAELFRIAPERADGIGRFIAPFAKAPLHSDSNHRALPNALDEFKRADQVVMAEISRQAAELDRRAMNAAKEAA
jgi:hypothetical protein